MTFNFIKSDDILNGVLEKEDYSLLLIPGGFAPHFINKIGEKGEEIIRKFVYNGGGYVGICAGAYCGS